MTVSNFLHICLPRYLLRIDDGKYVVLNLSSKPIGFDIGQACDFDQYPIMSIYDLTPALISQLDDRYDGSNEINLYYSDTDPTFSAENMTAYLKKLELLAALPVLF